VRADEPKSARGEIEGLEVLSIVGHASIVEAEAVSPDGKRIAAGSGRFLSLPGEDTYGEVKAWDIAKGTELLHLKGHGSLVSAVAFNSDGKVLASGSYDGTVRLWDAEKGKEMHTLKHGANWVLGVAFTPDGKSLVTICSVGVIWIWDVAKGTGIRRLKGHTSSLACGVAVRPDGKALASIAGTLDERREVKVWDLEKGEAVLSFEIPAGAICGNIAFHNDGKQLITGGPGHTVKVWDVAKGTELLSLKGHSELVSGIAVSPDGKQIATSSFDLTVRTWDAETGTPLHTFRGHQAHAYAVAFGSGGRLISGGSTPGGRGGVVKVWDPDRTPRLLAALQGHKREVLGAAVSPDGKSIVSCDEEGLIKVWEVPSARRFPPQGGRGSEGVRAKGGEVRGFKGHEGGTRCVSFGPDGKLIANGGADAVVRLWSAETGKELAALKAHGRAVARLAFSADGKSLVSGDTNGKVVVWDVESRKPVATIETKTLITGVGFNPTGKKLVTADGYGGLKLWDAEDGSGLLAFGEKDGGSRGVAWNPDGKRIVYAAGSEFGREPSVIKVWDVADEKEVLSVKGHTYPVRDLILSRDGKTIVRPRGRSTIRARWRSGTRSRARCCPCGSRRARSRLWRSVQTALRS
jgi:WD40 repeat protein